ncbi:MAG: hypothetical protein ACE37I_07235 [Rubinisphaera brasiliensis]|uniref:hypothetical protein n=1 Tax=Rubinisphaera brasiliensis TaxID=119 RepID=UPI0039197F77
MGYSSIRWNLKRHGDCFDYLHDESSALYSPTGDFHHASTLSDLSNRQLLYELRRTGKRRDS